MTVLILCHDPDVPLGHFETVLQECQLAYEQWYLWRTDPLDIRLPDYVTGLVILGGAMNVDDTQNHPFLLPERELIRQAIDRGLPVFGICLGAQLIARSLGAAVEKSPVREAGWTPIQLTEAGRRDPVLCALGEETSQFQWHEDTFHLPAEAVLLATNQNCPRQAFRLGDRVYGVQFHPEVTLQTIRRWLDAAKGKIPPERTASIWQESQTYFEQRMLLSQTLFKNFCQIAFTAPSPPEAVSR